MFFSLLSSCNASQVAVLILARGGSKGIRLKNLQKVGWQSLVSRAIQTARNAALHDITVSTDNFLIALETIKGNAKVFHRSSVTASDKAPSIWGVLEYLHKRPDIHILVLIQCTSPFLTASSLLKGLTKLSKSPSFDCIFSVTRSYKLRWKLVNENLQPDNFDLGSRPRRQDWGGDIVEAGAFYIARAELLNKGLFQNEK